MALTSIAGDAGTTSKTRNLGPVTWVVVAVAIVAALAFSIVAVGDGGGSATVTREEAPSVTLFNPGSSDAIERRALEEQKREAASRSVSEHGSPDAIEHRTGSEPERVGDDGDDGVPPNVR